VAPRAGPLAGLIGGVGALVDPAVLAHGWDAAVREIAWRLLLCSARERLLDSTRTHDCLEVELGSFGGSARVAVALARHGAFELDWPDLDSLGANVEPVLVDPLAIIDRLADREQLDARDRDRVRAEVVDSIVNLAQARLARQLRHALASQAHHRADLRLRDPEHFVTDGHPWHPMTRTRLGLRPAEVVRYASEQLAATPVGCVEVERGPVQIAGDYLDELPRWFGDASPGFVRIPVHPAQRRRLASLFPTLWASGVIRPVPATEPTSSRHTRSLLSLRTVALAPDRHLKLACDVHTTSTRRWVSPMSVANGPVVTRLIHTIQAKDPITAPLRLLAEAAAAGLDPDRVGPLAGQLGAIFREVPREPEGSEAWVCAAIGERWPGTDMLVLERAASGYPGGRVDRISALVDAWITNLVPPGLRLYCRYGVALELHLQNTLVRVADGRVAGFCVRDLGGIRIHSPRLAATRLGWTPSFAPRSFIVTDDLAEVRGKLEHTLFHAHLAHLFAIAGTLGVDEHASWARLRHCIADNLNKWADDRQDPELSDRARAELREELTELTRPRVRAKALLRMRLRERSSDYDYTEVANALAAEPSH
jgi:siderophore synthetase component